MISQRQIQVFFRDLARKGVALEAPMRWEFFFRDHDRRRLELLEPGLQAEGYVDIVLLEPAPDDDDAGLWFLRATTVEVHTPRSLYGRCQQLASFASKYSVETFDGFDVSRTDENPLY